MEDASARGNVLELFSDLVRSETRLYNLLDDRLRRQHGIVTSQYEFLRHVRSHERSRVADLAAEFAIGVGATSKAVDRLEARDLVRRVPHPGDRRSMVLTLTESGAELVEDAEHLVEGILTELLEPTTSSLQAAADTLRSLRRRLERDQLGTPAG